MTPENILEHFGVKGMKWGVRKKRSRQSSEDAQRHGAAKRKAVDELSDKELKDLVSRMNMEQQVKRMNPSTVARGNNMLKTTAALGGTVAGLEAFSKTKTAKTLGTALRRKFDKATTYDVSRIGRTG